eukprot:5761349-Alexandrium_andersonii.AAC.1
MSASLVGSEMCIRDRSVRRWWRTTTTTVARTSPRSQARALTLQRGLPTVSYTHLTLPTICSV